MNGKHAAALAIFVGAAGLGFLIGFAWGQSTRSAIGDATTTTYGGGKLTVEVDVAQAARQGLAGIL